ncbi:MAG TPA: MFS transporter [Burkholderiales bacterium]|nr:MFS transporter [Burkholderiales bacterium]
MIRSAAASFIVPSGVEAGAARVLVARALRSFGDGYVAVLLPAYLLALGFSDLGIGIVGTVTLLGSAIATLSLGAFGNRVPEHRLLAGAAFLMILTGVGFAGLSTFWPLLIVAFFGTLNPSGGDVTVFLPLEHARLAASSSGDSRTALFARYSLAGSLAGALGALTAALPEWISSLTSASRLECMRAMFGAYALIGVAIWLLYRGAPRDPRLRQAAQAPLGQSRAIVFKLAALFSVDAFAGGLLVHSLLALWLFQRFGMSLTAAATFFFWTGILSAGSQLAAAPIARRFGLLNTMVYTHIPSSVFLIAAALSPNVEVALAFMLLRSALSQMDVPTRSAYVMAVVTPPERPAAASFTAVPRSLAAAAGPALTGVLFSAGALAAPLIACGVLKIGYDLALLAAFRKVAPNLE